MAKRETIGGPDIMQHNQPFPTAVRVGNMVFSSAVGGDDVTDHSVPEDIETQVANAFEQMRRIMEKAGGSTDGIGKVSVMLKSRDDRKYVNPVWIEMFPDENDRPVRHTSEHNLVGGRLIQLEFIGVV